MKTSKSYPIYISKKNFEIVKNLISSKVKAIKSHSELIGTANIDEVLGSNFLSEIQNACPSIKGVSLNYYSCEGKNNTMIVAGIKFFNDFTDKIKINGEIYNGIKIRVTDYYTGGYLNNYFDIDFVN